jgi:hypothetical protein
MNVAVLASKLDFVDLVPATVCCLEKNSALPGSTVSHLLRKSHSLQLFEQINVDAGHPAPQLAVGGARTGTGTGAGTQLVQREPVGG